MRPSTFVALFTIVYAAILPCASMATDKQTQIAQVKPSSKSEAKKESPKDDGKETKPEEDAAAYNSITLRGLNKVTARSSIIEGPIGTVMRFGNLEMVASRCWKSPPEEQPENAALLEIWELKPKESPERIFAGWMFSSSPGLSSLQHAVYDITVVSCNTPENVSSEPSDKLTVKPAADIKKTPQSETSSKPEEESDTNDVPLD